VTKPWGKPTRRLKSQVAGAGSVVVVGVVVVDVLVEVVVLGLVVTTGEVVVVELPVVPPGLGAQAAKRKPTKTSAVRSRILMLGACMRTFPQLFNQAIYQIEPSLKDGYKESS